MRRKTKDDEPKFLETLDLLEKERQIPREVLLDAIENAIVSAYKKAYGQAENVRVSVDRETGEVIVLSRKVVVDEVFDDNTEVSLEEAKSYDARYDIDDVIDFRINPKDFGRIAAQAAKQVIIQKIREAERNMVYNDFEDKKGTVVTGIVNRKSRDTLYIKLGDTEGILTAKEQVEGEHYEINDIIKVYIMDVKKETKGPQLFLSRSHPGLVKGFFELEVPEIKDGIVEIKGIAREAGSRTKIAVYTNDENIDPVGACVGTRGSRVQAIVEELNDEKIDIIPWSEDPEELIRNVLSPAKVSKVIIEENPDATDKDEKSLMATAIVPDYQLSLAIGKVGQNVRLAAKVSGWKIDIKSESQYEENSIKDLTVEEDAADSVDEDGITTVNEPDEFVSVEGEDEFVEVEGSDVEAEVEDHDPLDDITITGEE